MNTVILDDVIQKGCFNGLQRKYLDNISGPAIEKWYLWNTEHYFREFCTSLINLAGTYYNLETCGGYEFWVHNHTKPPTWHVDNDERRRIEDGVLVFPLCSIVYYLCVEDLVGGELHISHNNEIELFSSNTLYEDVRENRLDGQVDDIFIPRPNRMIIFPPGKFHNVNSFTGKRVTLVINPWDVSKYKYPDYVHHERDYQD